MKCNEEVLELFVEWKKKMEKNIGTKIKVLCSDNGGEYTSDPFLQIGRKEGIERYFTVRKIPQQNGVAERMNMTLLEKVCCMLSVTPQSGGYGDVTAMYIRRSEIPSRIYAKHQYRQESECRSTVVIYIPIKKSTSTWLSQRVIQYYRNITSPEKYKVQYMKRYTKLRDAHEQ